MRKLTAILGLALMLFAPGVSAQASSDEIAALRAQIEQLTRRLDQLEEQNRELAAAQANAAPTDTAAATPLDEPALDEKIDQAVAARVDEKYAALSWAERINWSGDFRYRYENIDEEGSDERRRSRIRARTALTAQVTPTVEVGVGLATGGDDPVSANVTLGGGGSKKEINLDLAYFDWSGLENTRVIGGKFKNFLVRPDKRGLLWDGDWRPEGVGVIWDNETFFAQGLGDWLEGDSRNGTNFAWVVQGGMKFRFGETGKMMFGGGYAQIDTAGETPLFGDPDDFFGNSFRIDPATGDLVYTYDYELYEAFAEIQFLLAGRPVSLFADWVVNTDADDNDTGYLAGVQYGAAKGRGTWDVAYAYQRLEKDAVLGLLTDSDFGGGGTDNKGSVISGTYAFHDNWSFQLTYFINDVEISSEDPRDFDRLMLDLNFKFK